MCAYCRFTVCEPSDDLGFHAMHHVADVSLPEHARRVVSNGICVPIFHTRATGEAHVRPDGDGTLQSAASVKVW